MPCPDCEWKDRLVQIVTIVFMFGMIVVFLQKLPELQRCDDRINNLTYTCNLLINDANRQLAMCHGRVLPGLVGFNMSKNATVR